MSVLLAASLAMLMPSQVPQSNDPVQWKIEVIQLKAGSTLAFPKSDTPTKTEGLPVFEMPERAIERLRGTDKVASAPIVIKIDGMPAKITTSSDTRSNSVSFNVKTTAPDRSLLRLDFEVDGTKSYTEAYLKPGQTYGVVYPSKEGRLKAVFRFSRHRDK